MLNVIIKASSRYPIHRKKIKEVIARTLEAKNVTGDVEVEVNVIGDRKMTQLHEKFLDEPGTTDVLSFPLYESILKNNQFPPLRQDFVGQANIKYQTDILKIKHEEGFIDFPDDVLRLGSIFVSYPVAQKQANEHKHLVDDEINLLVEHSMLHLLGIHHEE